MASSPLRKHILITGANRGIGYCILKRLILAFPQHLYIIATRDKAAGLTAIDSLRSEGIPVNNESISVLELDVSVTQSIAAAADTIRRDLGGRLDVLINNAGIAFIHDAGSNDLEKLQLTWSKTFLVNVYAPHMIFHAFLPFLRESAAPRVINVSSSRGSLTLSSTGKLPPTGSISYSVSKAALNGLGVEMEKILFKDSNGRSRVWSANPGHCKTAFNNYRGARDPLDGAGVVEALLRGDEIGTPVESGFWEEENGRLSQVPW